MGEFLEASTQQNQARRTGLLQLQFEAGRETPVQRVERRAAVAEALREARRLG